MYGQAGQIVAFHGRSHQGLVRDANEDAWWASEDGGLLVVADGMGGLRFGRWASDQVVRAMSGINRVSQVGHMQANVEAALRRANWEIYNQARHLGARMGTTVAAICFTNRDALISWCGDSRVYIMRSGRLYQLTADHVTTMASGKEALSRAVGVEARVSPEFKCIRIQSGDRLLLCTDGVHHMLDDEDLAILLNVGDCQQAVAAIERQVLARGAPDNLTLIVVDI